MHYDEMLDQYKEELEGITFVWDLEPTDEYSKRIRTLSENYQQNLEHILIYIASELEDLTDVFGRIDLPSLEKKLGRPSINYEIGRVDYLEQTLDSDHIISFEFSDDRFQNLYCFSIDG